MAFGDGNLQAEEEAISKNLGYFDARMKVFELFWLHIYTRKLENAVWLIW